jgi:hypothetical protein
MLLALNVVRTFRKWWYGGPTVTRAWHTYFCFHLLVVLWLGAFSILDTRGNYFIEDFVGHSQLVIKIPFGIVMWIAVLSAPAVTSVGLGILYLARKGGPSFIAFGLTDMALCGVQWLAIYVACL